MSCGSLTLPRNAYAVQAANKSKVGVLILEHGLLRNAYTYAVHATNKSNVEREKGRMGQLLRTSPNLNLGFGLLPPLIYYCVLIDSTAIMINRIMGMRGVTLSKIRARPEILKWIKDVCGV